MQKHLNTSIINRGAGGTPMIDRLDETISSLRARIRQFKLDHPELYKEENDDNKTNSEYWKMFHSIKK